MRGGSCRRHVARKLRSLLTPDCVRTHVSHLSAHVVLLEGVNYRILQVLSHAHPILVQLALVSHFCHIILVSGLVVIHGVVAGWLSSGVDAEPFPIGVVAGLSVVPLRVL